jgi:predicted MFS family arabinose efflux permease
MDRDNLKQRAVPAWLLALAAGVAVANLYYLQPLLHLVAVRFHLAGANAGYLVTATQVGFVVGLAILLPLGDLIDRRKLMVVALVLGAAFNAAVAFSQSLIFLVIGLVGSGLFSVVAQLAVSYAAAAVSAETRSTAVSKVMSGLLAGIVMARTYSGFVARFASFRAVYLIAVAGALLLAVVCYAALPPEKVKPSLNLREIWGSAVSLWLSQPILRWRSALGMIAFACFSMFWTTMAFALAGPPHHLDTAQIGLFGFAGLAGVISARSVGTFADRGYVWLTTLLAFLVVALSFLAFVFFDRSLLIFAVLTATLDAGLQAIQLSNQSVIYQIGNEIQGRVTMVYMVNYFLGGVIGSSLASLLFGFGGFHLVVITGAILGVVGLGLWAVNAGRESAWLAATRARRLD